MNTATRSALNVLAVVRKDIGHVLVQPFQLVSHREAEVFDFLLDKLLRLLALLFQPLRRSDRRVSAASRHFDVRVCEARFGSKHAFTEGKGDKMVIEVVGELGLAMHRAGSCCR
jgi:hypothetical protein